MKRRLSLVVALAIAATAGALWAGRPGAVVALDGQRFEGDVTEHADHLTITSHGVTTTLPKDQVDHIDYSVYETRFRDELDKLAPEDTARRIAMAREAFGRREYPLAELALTQVLDFEPLNRDAHQLLSLVGMQIQMDARAAAAAANPGAAAGPTTEPVATRNGRRVRGLDDRQINRVRQLELKPGDRIRVQFRNNVKKRFVDAQPGGNFRAFSTRSDTQQAIDIIRDGTPEMVDDVLLMSDPPSLQTFGRRLHGAIVQGCATSRCHGGDGAGDFRLLGGIPDSATMLTNFYLLSQHTRAPAQPSASVFGGASVGMIERGRGKDSLLVQYALPRTKATHKHPEVRGWDGIVRDVNDRLADEMIHWMDRELVPLTPDYGFRFALPTAPAKSDANSDAATDARSDAAAPSTTGPTDGAADDSAPTLSNRPATQPATQPAGELSSRPGTSH